MQDEMTLKAAYAATGTGMPLPVRKETNAIAAGQASEKPAEGVRAIVMRVGIAAIVAVLLCAAWFVRDITPYKSGRGVGYGLGLVGGTLMLIMMLYPVRKHVHLFQGWGPLKYWFRFHMVAGILGPVLVVLHSAFHVGSVNAGVALASMLLVMASGLVGRFLYRKVHHGLYGTHATLKELQQSLTRQLESLQSLLHQIPDVKMEMDRFSALVSRKPKGWGSRTTHFMSLGWNRIVVGRRIRRIIAERSGSLCVRSQSHDSDLSTLLLTVDEALKAAQRAAQFSTYERLFSLWHVVHIPFLCMLVITAVVHVVAVHAY